MKTYQVVRRDTCDELEEAVNAFINQGWELVGGVSVSISHGVYTDRDDSVCSSEYALWAQAIKRAESEPVPTTTERT